LFDIHSIDVLFVIWWSVDGVDVVWSTFFCSVILFPLIYILLMFSVVIHCWWYSLPLIHVRYRSDSFGVVHSYIRFYDCDSLFVVLFSHSMIHNSVWWCWHWYSPCYLTVRCSIFDVILSRYSICSLLMVLLWSSIVLLSPLTLMFLILFILLFDDIGIHCYICWWFIDVSDVLFGYCVHDSRLLVRSFLFGTRCSISVIVLRSCLLCILLLFVLMRSFCSSTLIVSVFIRVVDVDLISCWWWWSDDIDIRCSIDHDDDLWVDTLIHLLFWYLIVFWYLMSICWCCYCCCRWSGIVLLFIDTIFVLLLCSIVVLLLIFHLFILMLLMMLMLFVLYYCLLWWWYSGDHDDDDVTNRYWCPRDDDCWCHFCYWVFIYCVDCWYLIIIVDDRYIVILVLLCWYCCSVFCCDHSFVLLMMIPTLLLLMKFIIVITCWWWCWLLLLFDDCPVTLTSSDALMTDIDDIDMLVYSIDDILMIVLLTVLFYSMILSPHCWWYSIRWYICDCCYQFILIYSYWFQYSLLFYWYWCSDIRWWWYCWLLFFGLLHCTFVFTFTACTVDTFIRLFPVRCSIRCLLPFVHRWF